MNMVLTKPTTVALFALDYRLTSVLHRALLFHPQIGSALHAVPVEWNPRLKAAAGNFTTKPIGISLHPALIRERAGEIEKTFLHEVAHAMQYLQYKEVNHGESWWEMMHQLGQKPERCHSMSLRARGNKTGFNPEDLGF